MFPQSSKELVSSGMDGSRSSNDVTENFPLSLNSVFILQQAIFLPPEDSLLENSPLLGGSQPF